MEMAEVPTKARAVIIGGGVIGCSLAYHLAKLGWSDVVLLERKQLTSGTTWHAAGLIAQLRATANMTKLAKYSQELYGNLEAETGVATWVQTLRFDYCGFDRRAPGGNLSSSGYGTGLSGWMSKKSLPAGG
jgi:glycine/D-amino acid oxidase-like deaminating enzyme